MKEAALDTKDKPSPKIKQGSHRSALSGTHYTRATAAKIAGLKTWAAKAARAHPNGVQVEDKIASSDEQNLQ